MSEFCVVIVGRSGVCCCERGWKDVGDCIVGWT